MVRVPLHKVVRASHAGSLRDFSHKWTSVYSERKRNRIVAEMRRARCNG